MASHALPWGKLLFGDEGQIVAVQSLADHSADVAAVFRALTGLRGIRERLSHLAGRPLDEETLERLAYLAFLHDCGKVNRGFQARSNPRAPIVGHIKPLAAIFGRTPDPSLKAEGYAALDAERLSMWGEGVTGLLDAIFSHHGRPWPVDELGVGQGRYWRVGADGEPVAALFQLRRAADSRFPRALDESVPPVPQENSFIHAVAGLVQLSDWIASSDWRRARSEKSEAEWARQQLERIGLDPAPWRHPRGVGRPSFREIFDETPYPAQEVTSAFSGQLVILESETGSGKTEAALYRFARLFAAGTVDGLYFALPTRTAAVQIHRRVGEFMEKYWGRVQPPNVLAVPGYLEEDDKGSLPAASDSLDGPEQDERRKPVWASEHPKRYFSALVSVGTIDQALLAALRVKHSHLRAAMLMRHLLVVDEVHASDPYMRGLLLQLLRDHLAAGGHALLLSATLGAEVRDAYLTAATGERLQDLAPVPIDRAIARTYPLVTATNGRRLEEKCVSSETREKCVRVQQLPAMDDAEAIARLALEAARAGAKVLVVRNSVVGAIEVQLALEHAARGEPSELAYLFQLAGRSTLHHGRFAREDRRALDGAVERWLGKSRSAGGMVVVGTQTLEQSLDIDADMLVTDLCPVDVLLQRIGRLHRHQRSIGSGEDQRPPAFDTPSAWVLTPANGLAPLLNSQRRGRRHGLGLTRVAGVSRGVYPDLVVSEGTRRLLEEFEQWRIPDMNRLLVERAMHTESIAKLIDAMPEHERDDWHRHRLEVEGLDIADSSVAAGNVLRRDEPFMEQPVLDDVMIATRLGANDRLVDLPAGTRGPFGWEIRRISVPAWMLRDAPVDEPPRIAPSHDGSGLRLEWSGRILQYDRLGLRLLEEGE